MEIHCYFLLDKILKFYWYYYLDKQKAFRHLTLSSVSSRIFLGGGGVAHE